MSPVLGYYGKLPVFGDIVKSDESPPTVISFRKWLDEATDQFLSYLSRLPEVEFGSLPMLRMVLRTEKDMNGIVAICMPSRDAHGRKAPFVLFAEVPDDLFTEQLLLVPVSYGLFFRTGQRAMESAAEAFSNLHQQSTLWGIREGLRSDITDSRMRYIGYLKNTNIGNLAFWHAGDSKNMACKNLLLTVCWSLSAARKSFSDQFNAVFRFPLTGHSESQEMEIAFWLDLVSKGMDIRLKNVQMYWTNTHFDLSFATSSRVMSLAWAPFQEDDILWDFCQMRLDPAAFDKPPLSALREIIMTDQSSLESLLAAVSKIGP